MRGNVSGGLASMGCGVPYALAAKMAFPDRCVVACVGDGAMQMLGMNEMISIARYAHEWEDPRLIVLVVNNRDLNMVTWEMRMGGDPKFEESQALPSFDFAAFAEVCGLVGIRMRTPADVVPGIERAFAADRPCIIDAHVDGRVPPLPPHIEPGALKKLVGALLKGDVDAGEIVRRSFEQTLDGLRPKKA
jgi:pyruvate dehydrogenase (quinone)